MSQAESPSKVSKSQHVVLTLPPTLGAMVQVVQPALDRLAIGEGGVVRLLVLVPDADTAHQLAAAVRPSVATPPVLVPVTSPARGVRLLAQQPVALVGAPREIAALLPSGQLKLGELAQLVVLQADLTLAGADAADVEAIMGELPKECPRTLTLATETEAVTTFVKSWLKRPRRVGDDVVADDARPVSLQFVPVAPHGRELALRRILDATNAPSVIVACEDEAAAEEATAALRVLGYPATDGSAVRAEVGAIAEHSALRILWDVPATRAALEGALGGAPVQAVALALPRQVAHLRSLLAGGSLAQLVLTEALSEAERDRARRTAQLEATLAGGLSVAELQAVEGLLESYDAMSIAAAALRLLDQEQATVRALRVGVTTLQPKVKAEPPATVVVPAAPAPVAAPKKKKAKGADAEAPAADDEATPVLEAIEQDEAPSAPVARFEEEDAPGADDDDGAPFKVVFINVGARDGATAGSLVGAITGETGLDRSIIGAIDLRDSHSLVEIATPHATRVVDALTGSVIRGKDVQAKLDTMGTRIERAPRGPRKFDRGDRPQRGGFGGGGGFGGRRPFDRDDRGDRGDRAPRGGGGFGGGRPFQRDDRGERPQRGGFGGGGFGKRPFTRDDRDDRGDRGPRGGGGFGGGRPFQRDDRGDRGPRGGGGFGGGRPFQRDDRGERPARGGFDRDRGPRGGGGGGFRRDNGVGPSRRGFDRRPDDFAERAERLERSRRPGGRSRLPFDEAGE